MSYGGPLEQGQQQRHKGNKRDTGATAEALRQQQRGTGARHRGNSRVTGAPAEAQGQHKSL